MKHKKPSLQELAALCAQPGPEDGLHPRELAESSAPLHWKPGHKDRQISKQVERALHLEMADLGDHPVLQHLLVSQVEPDPDATHLLVTVVPGSEGVEITEVEATAALARAAGRLRCAVAGAIHRKRTPELSFRFIPGGCTREEDGHA